MKHERRPVDAANVTTVDEHVDPKTMVGHIVRFAPSNKATDAQVELVTEELRQHAVAVKVVPRPPTDTIVLAEQNATVQSTMPKNVRAFLLDLIANSSSSRKDALTDYINELADEEGV